MNYEKKYKEAFKWIESLYPKFSHEQQMEAEAFFPELKESEGEKIRKVLVGWFKRYKEEGTCGSEMFNGISTDSILAWLEKQGETFTKKDVDDAYLQGISDTKHELGKQGEQKPGRSENDNSFCKENCKGYQETGRCFADGDCKDKREAEHPSKKG